MPGLLHRLLRRRQLNVSVSREVADEASDHLLEMDDALEELAALPGLEDFTATRALPPRFEQIWDRALAAYDRYLATMTSEAGGLDVRCQPGCAACCHDIPTGVQAVELLAIYAEYREFDDFAELHNLACDLSDSFMELLAAEAPDQAQVQSDSPAFQRAQLAYRMRRQPCVFLDQDQRCRVYARRPLTCRMHHAITDPSWCWVDHDEADAAITPRLEPPKDMLEHMRTITRRLGLELPTTLFAGLGILGGAVMNTAPLRISDRSKRSGARPKFHR